MDKSASLHLARFSDFLGIKMAGIEPAVPQIREIDAIWVGSELSCAKTLEACAEKVGFCIIAFATHDGDIAGHRKTPGAIDYCPIIPLALHCGYLK